MVNTITRIPVPTVPATWENARIGGDPEAVLEVRLHLLGLEISVYAPRVTIHENAGKPIPQIVWGQPDTCMHWSDLGLEAAILDAYYHAEWSRLHAETRPRLWTAHPSGVPKAVRHLLGGLRQPGVIAPGAPVCRNETLTMLHRPMQQPAVLPFRLGDGGPFAGLFLRPWELPGASPTYAVSGALLGGQHPIIFDRGLWDGFIHPLAPEDVERLLTAPYRQGHCPASPIWAAVAASA